MSAELEKCPFCEHSMMRMRDVGRMQQAHCDGCGAAGPLFSNAAPAIAAWNRRPPERVALTRYRLLNTGDVIEKDDEFIQDDGVTWLKPVGWEIGARYASYFKTARRPDAPTSQINPAPGILPVKESDHG